MELSLTPRQRRFAALAALLGNALEWYDFAVYGYVASALGQAFFPAEVPALQTMASFGVFAVGYLMRPVGSLVLGPLGDLLGRRLMLSLSIVIMGISSLALGLLNLLPVLPLDGGHIVMSLLEKVRGRGFSQLAYMRFSAVGLSLFVFLMYLGLRNDLFNAGG